MDKETADLSPGVVNKFETSIRKLMLTDRDYLIKSSRAFVSFIRSFKEHKLSNILKFKNLDAFETAKSFFLFKMPVMRELVDLKLDVPLATDAELEKFQAAEFQNKNQETMIGQRIKEAIEKRQGELGKRAVRKVKLDKEQKVKKVRSKAERNRAKGRLYDREQSEMTAEQKLNKKMIKGKLDKHMYEEAIDKIDKKHEYKHATTDGKKKK